MGLGDVTSWSLVSFFSFNFKNTNDVSTSRTTVWPTPRSTPTTTMWTMLGRQRWHHSNDPHNATWARGSDGTSVILKLTHPLLMFRHLSPFHIYTYKLVTFFLLSSFLLPSPLFTTVTFPYLLILLYTLVLFCPVWLNEVKLYPRWAYNQQDPKHDSHDSLGARWGVACLQMAAREVDREKGLWQALGDRQFPFRHDWHSLT